MPTVEQEQIYNLKAQVNKLQAQINFLYKHFNVEYIEEVNPADDPEVIKVLRTGNIMEAIKTYRGRHNAGLAEAQLAVEEMRTRLGL